MSATLLKQKELEAKHSVLKNCTGNVTEAARRLGIHQHDLSKLGRPTTLALRVANCDTCCTARRAAEQVGDDVCIPSGIPVDYARKTPQRKTPQGLLAVFVLRLAR